MHYPNLKLELYPADSACPVPVLFHVIQEQHNEYTRLSFGRYCVLHFRIIDLGDCSIWHTRFLINEKLNLRVTDEASYTFLWAGWRNIIHYAIKNAPRKKMPNDFYNVYHLPDVAWELHFPEPGEYETFNVLFKGPDLLDWSKRPVSEELSQFIRRSRENETAFLYESHQRLSSSLRNTISDLVRGPVDSVNRQDYYQGKITDLLFGLIRQLSKRESMPKTSLHPLEREQLYALRDNIKARPEKSYRLPELARKAGVNRKKLQDGFKQLFNTTVFGYIHEQRMQTANRLLRESNCRVKEVAVMTGYKNPSNFSEAFIKRFGYPPSRAARN